MIIASICSQGRCTTSFANLFAVAMQIQVIWSDVPTIATGGARFRVSLSVQCRVSTLMSRRNIYNYSSTII